MKKLFLCIWLLLGIGVFSVFADEIKEIRLDNEGHSKSELSFNGWDNSRINLRFVLSDVDDNGRFTINVTIDNEDDNYCLYLFTTPYSAKDLRRFVPPVVFYRGFRQDVVTTCSSLYSNARGWMRLYPGESESFYISGSEDNPSFDLSLPFYFAKMSKCLCQRHTLLDVKTEILQFKVKVAAPKALAEMCEAVDNKMNELSRTKYIVCNHKSGKMHHPSLEEQIAKTRYSLDSLKQMIIEHRNSFEIRSRRYGEFQELVEKLDRINLASIPVEECEIRDRTCSCPSWVTRLSMEDIYHMLENLYARVYTKEITKEQALSEAKLLKTHADHHPKRGSAQVRTGINKTYQKLLNYSN